MRTAELIFELPYRTDINLGADAMGRYGLLAI